MLKTSRAQSLWHYCVCILAFAIPLPFRFGSLAMIILGIGWLIQFRPKAIWQNLKTRPALWLWFIYFALHAISYTYSQNKEESLFDLGSKLSFVLLPLFIGTGYSINSKAVERIFLSFIAGVSFIALYTISKHAVIFWHMRDLQTMFYDQLVEGLDANAITQAWYTIFALAILLLCSWEHFLTGAFKSLKIILIILLTLFLVLLSARMLMALFFVFVLPYFIYISVKRFSTLKITIILAVFAALASLIVFTNNPVKKRYAEFINIDFHQSFLDDYSKVAEGDFNNLTLRVFLWRLGFENMNEHNLWLTGAGNGDVHKLQNDKMHQYGMNIYPPVDAWRSPFYNVNLHNMYLQSLLTLGIGGMVIFILISFNPFRRLNKIKYKHVFFVFNVIAIFVMMQEAPLQSQGGIIYYTFFTQLFWLIYYSRNAEEKTLINA